MKVPEHVSLNLLNSVRKCRNAVEESVCADEKLVRPRPSHDELWLICRLVDNQCWLLRNDRLNRSNSCNYRVS